MAIATELDLRTVDPVFLKPTGKCFFCGERLAGEVFIFCHGNDERGHQIWLHRNCAKRLSDQLRIDHENSRRHSG
jgi:hypothetical protein